MAKKVFWVVLPAAAMFGLAHLVFAAGSTSGCSSNGGLIDPLCGLSLADVVQNITKVLLDIAAPIATIMVLYGGFQMMTAGGEPEKFSNGRKTLLYAAIGFVVILLANQVPTILKAIFGA